MVRHVRPEVGGGGEKIHLFVDDKKYVKFLLKTQEYLVN